MKPSVDDRLNKVTDRLLDDDFLKGRGLGNEIAFYIFDYPPEDELRVRERIEYILNDINKKRPDLRVKHVNLFDLVIAYLQKRNLLDKAIEMQSKHGDAVLLSKLAAPLQAEKLAEYFGDAVLLSKLAAPLQAEKLAEYFAETTEPHTLDLMLVSGVGSVYPMLRAHSLLNNLHRMMGHTPLVMFFPGSYDGQSLSLFNKLHDENYYRAFKLVP